MEVGGSASGRVMAGGGVGGQQKWLHCSGLLPSCSILQASRRGEEEGESSS